MLAQPSEAPRRRWPARSVALLGLGLVGARVVARARLGALPALYAQMLAVVLRGENLCAGSKDGSGSNGQHIYDQCLFAILLWHFLASLFQAIAAGRR